MFKKASQNSQKLQLLAAIATIIGFPFAVLGAVAAWVAIVPEREAPPASAVAEIPPPDVALAESDIEQTPPAVEETLPSPNGRGGPFQPLGGARSTTQAPEPPLEAPPVVGVTQNFIAHPRWIKAPTDREVNSHYPTAALVSRENGTVTLSCDVLDDGELSCRVHAEEPSGLGFGAAALEVSRMYRVALELEDGTPSRGSFLRFEIRFGLLEYGAIEAEAWFCGPDLQPISLGSSQN